MALRSLLLALLLQLTTFLVGISAIDGNPRAHYYRLSARSAPMLPRAPAYGRTDGSSGPIRPKMMIVGMFNLEMDIWTSKMPQLLNLNITVPGLCRQFPTVHCTAPDGTCLVITGVGQSNAAASIFALGISNMFDLKKTYFMIGGIGGGTPERTTLGDVTFAKYVVQLDLQYELDGRDIPSNWTAGFFPLMTKQPGSYPGALFGTEAFELSASLRTLAARAARRATLNDTAHAKSYRAKYVDIYGSPNYAAARRPPKVLECDTVSSNSWWAGEKLARSHETYMKLLSNGSATYCSTQMEDNGTLAGLIRAAVIGLVDFKRVMIMRIISDFDRAPPKVAGNGKGLEGDDGDGIISELENLVKIDQGGFAPALENLYRAGKEVVNEITGRRWKSVYEGGVKTTNYVGDVINSLGHPKPDIGVEGFYVR